MKISLFDTHAHLDDEKYNDDRDLIINKLKENNIDLVCNIGTNLQTSKSAIELANQYQFIYATVGVHPYDAQEITVDDVKKLKILAENKKVVAIGEIGLDYFYDNCIKEKQLEGFEMQMQLADELKLPVVIHDRDAHKDTLDMLKKFPNVIGILHCFSGSPEFAKEVLKLGYYISFAGPLTYKNAKNVVEAAKVVPLDRVLIETDCPYLSPDGFRGQRNEPKNCVVTCAKLAEIKGKSLEEMSLITNENGRRIYGL